MRWIYTLLMTCCLLCFFVGCRDRNEAIEGKVKITSTDVFGKTKSMKSPPPQTPGQ